MHSRRKGSFHRAVQATSSPCSFGMTLICVSNFNSNQWWMHFNNGADGGTRTHRIQILSLTRIPIPSHPHGSGLSSTVTPVTDVCGRERLYIKLAEDTGIEPVSPFLNESLANSCRTLQHILHNLHGWSITILETNHTTFFFDSC